MTPALEGEERARPEQQKEILDDNARKFVVAALEPAFLERSGASAFILATDWLETGEDREKKLAYKKFENGDSQILLISKITKDGCRISEKEKISEKEYAALLGESVCHLEKMRYEFQYIQNGITFDIKYDEFVGSQLRVLEVDASSEEDRNSFSPYDFSSQLFEVTEQVQYYGYRVASIV